MVPIVFLLICGFLVILPMYVRLVAVGAGIGITLTGIPAYLFVKWRNKPKSCTKLAGTWHFNALVIQLSTAPVFSFF